MVALFKKHVYTERLKMKKDLFEHKSKSWDLKSRRVQSAKAIADTIIENIELSKKMHIMDFGAGTGLLSYCLSHKVSEVTAVDNSPSMLEVFHEKSEQFSCPTNVLMLDLSKDELPNLKYDGIVSSMTIHHIENLKKMFTQMHALLQEGGFIALADLEKEDGSFHSDNEGVFHFGFEKAELKNIVNEIGFKNICFHSAHMINKSGAEYGVFLMTAKK